jgi:hypothetical protein
MSSGLYELLALLIGYLALAAGIAFVVWRVSRSISSQWSRLALRAATLAFLFAPGAVACGGASIVPFSLVVVGDIIGLIAPNGCGPYTPLNLISFLPALAISGVALYFLESRRRASMSSNTSLERTRER